MITTFSENMELKKDIDISYNQYPIKVKCSLILENKGDTLIKNIKYSDKTNYDDTGINISNVSMGDDSIHVLLLDGKIISQGIIEEIAPGERIIIKYEFSVSCIGRGGEYSLNSFVRISVKDQSKSICVSSSLNFQDFKLELTCITRCKGAGGFKVRVRGDNTTLQEKIYLKGYMNVPDNISLKFTCIKGFYAKDNTTGKPIKPNDIVSNTIVAFFRCVKLQKCTTNSLSVVFKVENLSDLGDEKIISFLLLSPKLKDSSNSIIFNPPNSMMESINVSPRIKCCGKCFEKQS